MPSQELHGTAVVKDMKKLIFQSQEFSGHFGKAQSIVRFAPKASRFQGATMPH